MCLFKQSTEGMEAFLQWSTIAIYFTSWIHKSMLFWGVCSTIYVVSPAVLIEFLNLLTFCPFNSGLSLMTFSYFWHRLKHNAPTGYLLNCAHAQNNLINGNLPAKYLPSSVPKYQIYKYTNVEAHFHVFLCNRQTNWVYLLITFNLFHVTQCII